MEILRDCFPSSVGLILEELPESLDETYKRILKEIRRPNQQHAHRLLQCLVAAARPLHVKELAEILAFDFDTEEIPELNLGWRWEDQEEAVMSACSSLVMIVKDGDSQVVQFSHFSVKEFLTADRLAKLTRDVSCYHIRLEAAHTTIVRACLGVLLRLDHSADRDNIEGFPLARYAAQYWTTHARTENVSSRIQDGMDCLFDADKPHFATWIWLHNEELFGSPMSTMRPVEPMGVTLYYATRLGFRDLTERLIAKHPQHVNARGGLLVSPVHAAVLGGHYDILTLLVEHGADVNVQGFHCNTPLHGAAQDARTEDGQVLLNHGADIDALDNFVCTALMYATNWGHPEFTRMLLKNGATVDVRGWRDRTALHWAAKYGNISGARLLLEHGACVDLRDEDGLTPSQLGSGYQGIVELMSEYGAESVEEPVEEE